MIIPITMLFLLACTTSLVATPAPVDAVETMMPTAMPQVTSAVPDYAAGVQWTDINGDSHLFMVEDPPMAEYKVDFVNWSITIPNTDQKITVLRYGAPRGSILVGVWTYTHEDDVNLLIDVAVMGMSDTGKAIEGLTVGIHDQSAKNMQLSQLKFSKDLIGTTANISPNGFSCEVIKSDPDGNVSESDGSSTFVAFICAPSTDPLG